jgi:transcription initiation factor TFIID TATA-box-binding protein
MPKKRKTKQNTTKKPKKAKLDVKLLEKGCGDEKLVIPPYVLVNVVSTFSLGVKDLDLQKLAQQNRFFEFNPQTFAASTLRTTNPRTTALAFASGNMVCTGARNELESRLAARKYCRILQNAKIAVMFKNFKIQNIVASAAVGFTIKLQEIANDFGPYTTYDADLFPGLIFRCIEPKLVFLIFRSGKIVITGAKNQTQIKWTYETLYKSIIIKYKDVDGSTSSSSAYRNEIRQKRRMEGVEY